LEENVTTSIASELVVLCTPEGAPNGELLKRDVHHRNTPLHLAFSCYLFDQAGRFLVTERALTKSTWPGVRTNSCCGHPAPGESMRAAISRRLGEELGVQARDVQLVLPAFSYRAEMSNGTVENELCPVYSAVVDDSDLTLDPAEVHAAEWMPWPAFQAEVLADADVVSPWCALQVAELNALGPDPLRWPVAAASALPTAAVA
jgi:isopentenyl-diphosphate delta-isomerase